MARPLRIEFPGALYHVTSRGNARADIYDGDADRQAFLDCLGRVCARFNWVIHAYCLMSNHYHLLIETPDANLSGGMRQLNGVYTQQFNRRHGRVGHVFQGRYKAILVDGDAYLLELARYIVLNPVRAGMVDAAADWVWSSYRATVGLICRPDWLVTHWLLSAFSSNDRVATAQYADFVADSDATISPWPELRQQIYLGSDAFVERMQADRIDETSLADVPRAQSRPPAAPLSTYESRCASRDQAIAAAYASGGHTLRDIGTYFGLHSSYVSRIVRRVEKANNKA